VNYGCFSVDFARACILEEFNILVVDYNNGLNVELLFAKWISWIPGGKYLWRLK
jgi:hypothetical protein